MSFRWWSWSAMRWLEHGISYLTTAQHSSRLWMEYPNMLLRIPAAILSMSIVDDVYWSLVTAVESIALVSVVCSFYLICGCTI